MRRHLRAAPPLVGRSGDVTALARADAALVAVLPGVSTRLAAKIIASAAELLRTRGERVLVGTQGRQVSRVSSQPSTSSR